MGKNKLAKFAELKTFPNVFEYPRARLISEPFPFKGKWDSEHFGNDNPIVLELGCGKGEYTVGLARKNGGSNFIGVDVKGARIWRGAKTAYEEEIGNAAFLRAEIENIDMFFDKREVNEIWITFPDPQLQKTRKRLTSSRFLEMYRKIMVDNGIISLKTDSPFLYAYTLRLAELNGFEILENTDDLYSTDSAALSEAREIRTYYEEQWLARGKSIKLLRFRLPADKAIEEPETDDIPKDDYRSYPRGVSQVAQNEKH